MGACVQKIEQYKEACLLRDRPIKQHITLAWMPNGFVPGDLRYCANSLMSVHTCPVTGVGMKHCFCTK